MGSTQSTTHDVPESVSARIISERKARYEAQQRQNSTRNTATQHTPQNTVINTLPFRPESTQRQNSINNALQVVHTNEEHVNSFECNDMFQNAHQFGKSQQCGSTRKVNNLVHNKELLNNHKDTDCRRSVVTIKDGFIISRNDNNKSTIKPPNKLNDLDDFIKNWNVWQEQFTSFLICSDRNKEKEHEWGNFLLHFMGPVGHQILNSLFFDEENDKRNYAILMRKYKSFYEFYTAAKFEGESIMDYIERLKSKAALDIRNVDDTLKEKIAKDIQKHYKERFITLARCKLPYFKFVTTFKSLTLAEIAFLWKICEESNFQSKKNCIHCGKFHQEGQCPAMGRECNKCKRRNHFAKCCPGLMYIYNCGFCGGDHRYKECLAYGETCSKCGMMHHFSWKCSKEMLLKNCRFCGLSHLKNKNKCPAKNSLCCICKQRGHYEVKCDKMQNAAN